MVSVLVTGGCGFIGSNFIRHLLSIDRAVSLLNLDKLTSTARSSLVANLNGILSNMP